jgi:ABC-type cobalamin/Fe3+-siderophores transport system ATPase subunit
MEKLKSLRIIFKELSGETLIAETLNKQIISVKCNDLQQKELKELAPLLRPGNIFNLLNASPTEDGEFETEFIVFEPDYLIDVSSLAECFRPYGNHLLNYSLSRLQSKEHTAPILLGNAANFFIDEFINADESNPVDYTSSLKKLFQTAAFEFTACEDLKNPAMEKDFFDNCRKHFNHIGYAVNNFLPKAGIDSENVVLEPAFISNALGLQGRLDMMLCDYSAFIELKSGKALEDFRSGGQFIHSAENHYTQMILYLAMLEFNLGLSADDVRSYLLYSKYPVLSKEKHSRKQLQEALTLRNQIVAEEYRLQSANNAETTWNFLSQIDAKVLNTKNLSGKFFDNYLAPHINRFHTFFYVLSEDERAYFLRVYTFILKELWLSKAGEREYEGVKNASVIWNAAFEDKLNVGELLYDLKITENRANTESHNIQLQIPEYKDLYLPNFRQGDSVVLYQRNSVSDTVHNHQVFKGSIESLEANSLKIRLRYRQKNQQVWDSDALYAVEHDYIDTSYTGMFRALNCFAEANQDRKDLLLNKNQTEQSSSCFLLVGPPGTGKTSIALKKMVQDEIGKNGANILLLSYTNRAVDEICNALSDISQSLPFIRIGNELSCDPKFRHRLLEHQIKKCKNRNEVTEIIRRCRIFVGTVISVWNKSELFQLKHFNLAIIDEATQLLEPHLLGVFCAKNSSGENAVERFVLIGDHKQLPAVVLQSKEESKVHEPALNRIGLTDLSNSLFERLYRKYCAEGRTSSFDILHKQGRMHPEISAFPSEHFYEGQLACVGLPHQKEEWVSRSRLYFYSVKPSGTDFSDKSNLNEALTVVKICRELYQNCIDKGETFIPQTIGIITTYRNQIALIRKQLHQTGIKYFTDITVDTVERFQGSQRDTIIYSFCIKTDWQLKTLPNLIEENGKSIDRKLNVMLTRARKQLYLVGDEDLLQKNPIYSDLIRHIRH